MRTIRPCAALALAFALQGCVAALAVPAMTAMGARSEKNRAAPMPPVADTPTALAQIPEIAPAEGVRLTDLTELPPPAPGPIDPPANPWRTFAAYALGQAEVLAASGSVESALLTPGSAVSLQVRQRGCSDREPAVLIDLDPGKAVFAPDDIASAPPEAAAEIARLREAGVVVLWASQTHANEVDRVADALKASGLDPTGRDPILLVRNEDERKQVLREKANEAVCVVAIAGDERGDFDELFDYLRDPTLATFYDQLVGAGWFLVPPLSEAPAGAE